MVRSRSRAKARAACAIATRQALQRERDTWERVQGLPGEAGFSEEAWERWRDAVDARERAARLLINHALTGERSQSSSAPSQD